MEPTDLTTLSEKAQFQDINDAGLRAKAREWGKEIWRAKADGKQCPMHVALLMEPY